MSEITEQERETTPKADEPAKTIWDKIDEIMRDVPDAVLSRLPTDGAERHDHYPHGVHKQTQQES